MAIGVRGSNPIWAEFDLQGNLFDDTFYMNVLENTIPYIPATVYHDPNLTTPWDNPIWFLGNGTLPVDIFFEPDKVYRLEFRQNNGINPPSQSDPLIYEVNDYVAGTGGDTPIDTVALASSNQITNPQFAVINFFSPLSISATDPDPIEIAPGWFLDVAGTGTAVITQVPLNDSNANPSNAPYALQITLTGWTPDSVFLRQRLQQNGMLWANKFVSSALTAKINGAPQSLQADLVSSEGVPLGTVLSVPSVTQQWNEFTGYAELTDTTNTDIPPDAYIDYKLALPNTIDIYLTSFQLVVQELPLEPAFEQDSINRQIDHTFNYYKDPLEYKPIPSLLTGWDFPLNPAQFGASKTITTTPAYIWDQTICASAVNNVNVTRLNTNNAFSAVTTVNNDAFYMMQYLSGAQAFETTLSKLSVNISAYLEVHPDVTIRVYLYYSDGGGTIPTLPVTIGTLASSGVFTLTAANWSLLPQNLGFANKFTLGATAEVNDFKSIGWQGDAFFGDSSTANFAIVVSFAAPTAGTQVIVNSISCVPGMIATRPAPLSLDDTLRRCQFYYEKSYDPDVAVGTASVENSLTFLQSSTKSGGATNSVLQETFGANWKQTKRTIPNFAVFSTITANTAAVTASYVGFTNVGPTSYGGSGNVVIGTFWTQIGLGTQGFKFAVTTVNLGTPCFSIATASGVQFASAWLSFHYTADARLGVV